MLLVVLDANILASAAVAADGSTLATLMDAWTEDRYLVSVSPEILVELERTLQNPYFSGRLDQATRMHFLALVQQTARVLSISFEVHGVATHPEDDLILATAVSAHADYLVTGDDKLQKLETYQGVKIVSPRHFLSVLELESKEAGS